MPDYDAIAARAATKLAEYGQAVTVQEPLPAGGGWEGGGTRPDAVSASFLETGYSITHRSETVVQAGDMVGFLDSGAGAVEAGWTLTIDGVEWQIIDAQRLSPGGTRIMTEVIARR